MSGLYHSFLRLLFAISLIPVFGCDSMESAMSDLGSLDATGKKDIVIYGFSLLDGNGNALATIDDGAQFELSELTGELSILAQVSEETNSVEFVLNNQVFLDNKAPFEVTLTAATGSYSLTVTGYMKTDKRGASNTSGVSFKIVDSTVQEPAPEEPMEPAPEEPMEPAPEEPMEPAPEEPVPPTNPPLDTGSVLGNPNFTRSSLPNSEARLWYDRMWIAINKRKYDGKAGSGNLYEYGRNLHTYIQTLSLVFRVTGDLKILDEIVRLTQMMRGKLADTWKNTLDGTDAQGKDGYLNWLWLYDEENEDHYGKDMNMLDEVKSHSMLVTVIYMFEINRKMTSPAGYKYGELSDFWKNYFFNHFIPKWRERRRVKDGSYRVFTKSGTHTIYSITKMNYYLYKLFGDTGYIQEANYWANHLWNDVKEISGPSGLTFMWPKASLSYDPDTTLNYLHPATYARYSIADAVEFYFEGYHNWKNESSMVKFARTIADFLLKKQASKEFSRDIGGNTARAGYPTYDGFRNMNYEVFLISPYASMLPWDPNGKIEAAAMEVLDDRDDPASPREIYIPVGMLMKSLK